MKPNLKAHTFKPGQSGNPGGRPTGFKTLTNRQKAFIEEYRSTWNATEAARRAGYRGNSNVLGVTGHDLLRNPKIAAAIEQRLKNMRLSADHVLALLADIANSNLGDFLDGDGRVNGKAVLAKGHLVKRYKPPGSNDYGRIELHDRQKALITIGRMLGMFSDSAMTRRVVNQIFGALDEALVRFVPAENQAVMMSFLRERLNHCAGQH